MDTQTNKQDYKATHYLGMTTNVPHQVAKELLVTGQATKVGDHIHMGSWILTPTEK